jgi:hypothetical protein
MIVLKLTSRINFVHLILPAEDHGSGIDFLEVQVNAIDQYLFGSHRCATDSQRRRLTFLMVTSQVKSRNALTPFQSVNAAILNCQGQASQKRILASGD